METPAPIDAVLRATKYIAHYPATGVLVGRRDIELSVYFLEVTWPSLAVRKFDWSVHP
jgi:hypothetical protein